jgi:hypothetical protein
VIEIAVVVVQPNGQVEREFVSLVNPGRDIGPTRIHGLMSEDVMHAPTFGELAGQLLAAMNGCVALAGHNIRFDRQFMDAELSRLGLAVPEFTSLCTMQLAGGGNLSGCCREYGVEFDGTAHHALSDARGTIVSFDSEGKRENEITVPNRNIYGVSPFLIGTVVSSVIALIFALPLGLAIAIFLSEDFLPLPARQFVRFTVEMLAAIPSVSLRWSRVRR